MSDETKKILFDIDGLPALTPIAVRMVELLGSAGSSADDMARVVSGDPVISARVLKIANSPFYSMARQVKTLPTAIVVLGEKTVKNLVFAASLRGINQEFGQIEQMLWEDSMTCALGSRFLARKLQLVDPEEAFLGGLFRHVGRVVFNKQNPDRYRKLVLQGQGCGAEIMTLEDELFGINHSVLGAAILRHWQLPELMAQVVIHHHDERLAEIVDVETRNLTAIVNIASEFPLLCGIFGDFQREIDLAALPGAELLDLDSERLVDLLREFREIFVENHEAFLS